MCERRFILVVRIKEYLPQYDSIVSCGLIATVENSLSKVLFTFLFIEVPKSFFLGGTSDKLALTVSRCLLWQD